MPINRGVDKEDVVHIMEYYSAIKRKEITAFPATWLDLEIIMVGEVRQTVRHQNQMLYLHGESKKRTQ